MRLYIILLSLCSLFFCSYAATTGGTTTGGSYVQTNYTLPIDRCTNVSIGDVVTFPLCVKIDEVNCNLEINVDVDDTEIFSQSSPVSEMKNNLKNDTCRRAILPTCKFCTIWENVILNSSFAQGCGRVEISCLGVDTQTIDIGCFRDETAIPECFAQCTDNCNFNGICVNGFCQCNSGFSGDSCTSQSGTVCPNDCGGSIRGECVNGACVCTARFSGEDCSTYMEEKADSESNSHTTAYLVGFLVPAGVIGAAAGGYIYYRKRKNTNKHTFALEEEH